MPVTLLKNASLLDATRAFQHPEIRNILLAGPPGVGKTTFAFDMAEKIGLPGWKWQLHAESTPSEGYGFYVPAKQGFGWEAGPIDLAYHTPGVLILDEIVEASGPVKVSLYGALDTGKGGVMSYVGRTFRPKPGYKVIATMNGVPYEGGLPDALLDRFDATFVITKPGVEQLALLDSDLQELCIDSYETARDPILGPEISFRMLRSLQTLRGILPLDVAVMSACHGNDVLAGSLLEALALLDPPTTVTVAHTPAHAAIKEKAPASSMGAKRPGAVVQDVPDLEDEPDVDDDDEPYDDEGGDDFENFDDDE